MHTIDADNLRTEAVTYAVLRLCELLRSSTEALRALRSREKRLVWLDLMSVNAAAKLIALVRKSWVLDFKIRHHPKTICPRSNTRSHNGS